MARDAEHEDVGAGAEHALAGAHDDDDAHFRTLEADAVDGVVELDIDAEVIAVELELVAGTQAGVLVEVGKQRRDRPVELELPVLVAGRLGLIVDPVHGVPVHRQFIARLSECIIVRYRLSDKAGLPLHHSIERPIASQA